MSFRVTALLLGLLIVALAQAEETYHKRGNWIKEHGTQAGRPSATCYECHSASDCSSCHNKRQELLPETKNPESPERSYVHRGDFRSRHAGEARTNPANCLRCHTSESCQSCHTREGLSIGTANFPHPAGWMVPGSSQFHGKIARQDIALCATCHERGAATNCITCHATSATTTSPHPPGWQSSLNQLKDPACKACH